MRVLGIEGTAWAASAALYDADADSVFVETDPYEPDSGGIHPREAAEHMGEAIPSVVGSVLDRAREEYGPDPVDAVAFSRGPGLGPCLRIAATAARALAGTLAVPLVGVNHMVAHLEIGRHRSGFESPVCLNASGANAHLLAYRDGRYRVLGETMDTGVGNAIDKFTRHLGWSHPGGPKVESAAGDGDYIDLPYVVKGMDFSFSGITSAAIDAVEGGEAVEDVCFSLQENVFAMLTEVAERALSLTGADELVLGGGVGNNDRLRGMLDGMCRERGANFFAPEPRFLSDNAGMIAVLGAKMYAAGDTVEIAASAVDPDFRPDEVPVTWRAGDAAGRDVVGDGAEGDGSNSAPDGDADGDAAIRGAEALVEIDGDRVRKRRLPKAYRHAALDERLRRERTVLEARLTSEARRAGVPTPLIHDVDVRQATLSLQFVGDADLAAAPTDSAAADAGAHLGTLHRSGIVHGDPTTRNVRIGDRTFLIDFGLGYHSDHVEDHAMDCHVFEQSVVGTATSTDRLLDAFESGYRRTGAEDVLARLREVEGRGRYR